ncbi:MAG: ArsR/SmtB family transcription factor [Candidatus Limnocylindria bacterium]
MSPERREAIDPAAVARAEARMLPARSHRDASRILECLCDPTRLKLVRALQSGELAAGDLAIVVGRSRSATSQHLKVLRDADAVQPRREGNVVRYRLSDDLSGEILDAIGDAFDRLVMPRPAKN